MSHLDKRSSRLFRWCRSDSSVPPTMAPTAVSSDVWARKVSVALLKSVGSGLDTGVRSASRYDAKNLAATSAFSSSVLFVGSVGELFSSAWTGSQPVRFFVCLFASLLALLS